MQLQSGDLSHKTTPFSSRNVYPHAHAWYYMTFEFKAWIDQTALLVAAGSTGSMQPIKSDEEMKSTLQPCSCY
jgi:hypothetical protein